MDGSNDDTEGTFSASSGVDFKYRPQNDRQSKEKPASDSESADEIEIGTEAHNFKSIAPRPIGSPLSREITVDLLRYRRACQGYSAPRKSLSCSAFEEETTEVRTSLSVGPHRRPVSQGKRVKSAPNTPFPQRRRKSIVNNISFVRSEDGFILTIGDHYQKKEPQDERSRHQTSTKRTSFGGWLDFYSGNMVQKQRLIEQYLGCCAYLKRPPILRNQLRCFLLKPSLEHLDFSGSAVTSNDVASVFCAMAGRGCGLKTDKVINFQKVCSSVGDAGLKSIDISGNILGAEGATILANALIDDADFFRITKHIEGRDVHSALLELDLSSNILGVCGSKAVKSLLTSTGCTIQVLQVRRNLFGDQGCSVVASALLQNQSLRVLGLSENGAANSAGMAIGTMLEKNAFLEELDLNYNHLRGAGAKGLCLGLSKNSSLKILKLQWNGFGDAETMSELARAIPTCGVTSLNLAHNRILLKGASILASTLESGSELREINLDDNMIGQIGVRNIFRAAQTAAQFQEFPTSVSTMNCGTHIVDKSAFDPSETAGTYELDLKDSYNRSVLANLIRLNRTGNGSFVSIKTNGKPSSYNATIGSQHVKITDNGSIDMSDWKITNSNGYELPIVPENDATGQPVPLQATWARILSRREESVSCTVSFSFSNNRKRPSADDRLPQKTFDLLYNAFLDPNMSVDQYIDLIDIIFGSDVFISIDQVETLLSALSDKNDAVRDMEMGKVRICFMSRCFHKLVESGRSAELLDKLSSLEERRILEKTLGAVRFLFHLQKHQSNELIACMQASFEFTRNNPTGFHKLNLAEPLQREICLRLIELKNEAQDRVIQFAEFYSSPHRGGGRREAPEDSSDLERVWRNSKLDGVPFRARSDWRVPYNGILEVDFVQITKPQSSVGLPTGAETVADFPNFLQSLQKEETEGRVKISLVRKYSNTHYFSCQQLAAILASFTQPELRVEVCVIGFARTLDWHGYKNVTLRLDPKQTKILHSRIGLLNLFDDVMAVDYYELDLSKHADRFVMQELLHLASMEPGHNMFDCIFQDIDFVVPSGWLKDVPRIGQISLYYCREQRVIEKVFENGAWDESGSPFHLNEEGEEFGCGSWSNYTPKWLQVYCEPKPQAGPVPACQPCGSKWVRPYKIRRIKMKMMEQFQDPTQMFKALDKDGGGSLDRKELAMGLFALGVWLAPTELQALVDILDRDGGGDIDPDEFRAFWHAYSFD